MPPKKKEVKKAIPEESDSSDSEEETKTKRKKEDKKEDRSTFNVKELDLNKLHPYSKDDTFGGGKYAVIGRPGRGKTKTIKGVLNSKRSFIPVCQYYSSTATESGDFNFTAPIFGFDELKNGPVEQYIERQKLARKHLANPWIAEVWDDVTHDPKILHQPLAQKIYKGARHWKTLKILSLQIANDLKIQMRSLIDGTFMLSEDSAPIRHKLWESWSSFDDEHQFYDVFDSITEEKGCALFIDNIIQSKNLEDRVFWYKADLGVIDSDWNFGCAQVWAYNDERIKPEDNIPSRVK